MDKVKVLIAVDPQVVSNLPRVGGGFEILVADWDSFIPKPFYEYEVFSSLRETDTGKRLLPFFEKSKIMRNSFIKYVFARFKEHECYHRLSDADALDIIEKAANKYYKERYDFVPKKKASRSSR